MSDDSETAEAGGEQPDLALLTRLGTLPDATARKAFLARHPEVLQKQTVLVIRDLVLRQVRIEPHSAIALAEAAMTIAESLEDPESQAQALRLKANSLYFNGRYREAVDYYDRTVRMFGMLSNENEVARTLSSSIQPRILLGEYDVALKAAEQARA